MIKWLRKSEKGQAMVEMALVLPILLLLVGAIVDFGWLFYSQLALNNAAREGARYAVIHYNAAGDWKQDAQRVMDNSYVGVSTATAEVADPDDSQIRATMSARVPILTGIASTVLQTDAMDMTGTCVMRLES